jgi:hypothetical protein
MVAYALGVAVARKKHGTLGKDPGQTGLSIIGLGLNGTPLADFVEADKQTLQKTLSLASYLELLVLTSYRTPQEMRHQLFKREHTSNRLNTRKSVPPGGPPKKKKIRWYSQKLISNGSDQAMFNCVVTVTSGMNKLRTRMQGHMALRLFWTMDMMNKCRAYNEVQARPD